MSINEFIVKYTALEWFGELGYAVENGPQIASGEPAAERASFGEVVLHGQPTRNPCQFQNPVRGG